MIPMLCQACHKYHHATVVKACPFCNDVQFPEAILCDLVREGHSEKHPFHCAAFRPTLSVVHHEQTEESPTEEGSDEDTADMSPQDKWFRAYAVQQLGLNPDLIAFTIRYHVVFSTRQRTNVFSNEHGAPMADLVRQAAVLFEQTTLYVVWLASDHMHLHIDTSPAYALDEIVHAIMESLEQETPRQFSALKHNAPPVWEQAYFDEGIG